MNNPPSNVSGTVWKEFHELEKRLVLLEHRMERLITVSEQGLERIRALEDQLAGLTHRLRLAEL